MKLKWACRVAICLAAMLLVSPAAARAADRTAEHDQYGAQLWQYVQDVKPSYKQWTVADDDLGLPGPARSKSGNTYLNGRAAAQLDDLPHNSLTVDEHCDDDGNAMFVTVRLKAKEGYDARNADWYWAHYLADGTLLKTSADKNPYVKDGFVTVVDDGRLWVFPDVSADLVEFFKSGEPAQQVIRPGVGPLGMTLKSSDTETSLAYLVAHDGFETFVDDGRIWVFPAGSPAVKEYEEVGEPGKYVIRPGAGPLGMTVKALDNDTMEAYLRVATRQE